MRKRFFRIAGALVFGTCLQFVSCGNKQIGELLASGITDTISAVSDFAIGRAVSNAFGGL